MSFFVVLVLAVAMGQSNAALSPAEEHTCSITKDQRSLLANLLMMSGYSEVCIASALEDCGTGRGQSSYAPLVEVVQQLSATVNKLDSHLSAVVNLSDTLVSAAAHISDTLVSAAANVSDSQVSVTANVSNSQASVTASMSDSQVSVAANASACQISAIAKKSESLPRHCRDLLECGDSGSGMRKIYPYPELNLGVDVFCDQSVDGGGWTVFQKRTNETTRENFQRNWMDYQTGFGDMTQEFWLGLNLLHQLTSTTQQQLRIDLEDYEGAHRYAEYGYFHVDGPNDNYRLSVRNYSGDAGDSLAYHNNRPFSTHDRDNDGYNYYDCAERCKGAWWYGGCQISNLNGYQHVGNDSPGEEGIEWGHWRGRGYSLKRVSMMTRPSV